MEAFDAEYGNIHFVFADDDDFYTENLRRLDRNGYLADSLRQGGYSGIFFIQAYFNETCQIMMDGPSADIFRKSRPQKFWWGKSEELSEVSVGKKRRYLTDAMEGGELAKRLHSLIKKGNRACRLAFVMPVHVFAGLYQGETEREELRSCMYFQKTAAANRTDNRNFVYILTASMDAADSFFEITGNPQIFGSALFPQLRNFFDEGRQFQVYEELENVLGPRYHSLNRMDREDLLRMLLRESLDGFLRREAAESPASHLERLRKAADFLYAWYHDPDFEPDEPGRLPDKDEFSLRKLRECLAAGDQAEWKALKEYPGQREETSGREIRPVSHRKPQTAQRPPVFASPAGRKRLRKMIGIYGTDRRSPLYRQLCAAERLMVQPWNNRQSAGFSGLEEVSEVLGRVQGDAPLSEDTVKRILDFLIYANGSRRNYESENISAMKYRCYKSLIDCTCSNLKEIRKTVASRKQEGEERFQRVSQELRELKNEKMDCGDYISRWEKGDIDLSYLALHAVEFQKKGYLLQLNESRQSSSLLLGDLDEEIRYLEGCIDRLERMLSKISDNRAGIELADLMRQAAELLSEQDREKELIRKKQKDTRAAEKETEERISGSICEHIAAAGSIMEMKETETDTETDIETDRKTNRKTNRKTDIKTDTETDTDTGTDTETDTDWNTDTIVLDMD